MLANKARATGHAVYCNLPTCLETLFTVCLLSTGIKQFQRNADLQINTKVSSNLLMLWLCKAMSGGISCASSVCGGLTVRRLAEFDEVGGHRRLEKNMGEESRLVKINGCPLSN